MPKKKLCTLVNPATISPAIMVAWAATLAGTVAQRAAVRPTISTVSSAFSLHAQPHSRPLRQYPRVIRKSAASRYKGRGKGCIRTCASSHGRGDEKQDDVSYDVQVVVSDGSHRIVMGTRANPNDYYQFDGMEKSNSNDSINGVLAADTADIGDISDRNFVAELEGGDVVVTTSENQQSLAEARDKNNHNNNPGDNRRSRKQLKEELRHYRMQQSKPINKPPYTVFTNKALEEICDMLPTTDDELLDVNGIGPKKLEKFGDDILRVVAKYVDGGLKRDDSSKASNGGASSSQKRKRVVTIHFESLTEEQRQAAMLPLEQGTNVFVTGAAGTGKSYVLKYLMQEMHNRGIKYGVAAPTGVAAINVGGSTLHSFFGIGLGTGSIPNLLKKVKKNTEAMKRIDGTDVLCIDECSMLSSDLMETLDAVVRELRHEGKFKDKPFGGMQILCFGDFFQLPPVYKQNHSDHEWRPFCFDSQVWSELELDQNTYELKEIQRQDADGRGSRFVKFLNMVRVGSVTDEIMQSFNDKCLISPSHPLPTDGIVPTRLYSHNRNVDEENESRLAALEGQEVICNARDEWREKIPTGTPAPIKKSMKDSIEKEMPNEVKLKIGAQVMLTRNKDLDRGLVNGSRGVVEQFVYDPDDDKLPVVRFDCGETIVVKRTEAVRYNPSGEQGCLVRTQLPLKLAWAVTVHKCQGTTLTRATLDISSAFEFGQCYVALSRVRSVEGLWLERPARLQNIHVSPQVLEYYDNI